MSTTTILLIILSVLVAGALSFYQYLYKAKSKSKLYLFLAFLRFLSYFLVFLLLINPVISRKITENTKTPLAIYFDNSESIKLLKGNDDQLEIVKKIESNSGLKDKFDVQFFTFDKSVASSKELNFNGKNSKIDEVGNHAKQLFKHQLYPIILATDGNQTEGTDFVYAFGSNANVFPIAVGDTTKVEDLKINLVNCNKYAFYKNQFPVEIFSQYSGYKNINATLTIFEGTTAITKQNISFSPSKRVQTTTILLNADKIGLKKYKAVISSSQISERNKSNNEKYFAVEVLDQRTEIALVSSITHPDLGVLKRSIEANQQRKVTIVKPKSVNDLSKYNVFIFYQPNPEFSSLINQVKNAGINSFFITGKSTDFNLMNNAQNDLTFKMTNQKENYTARFNPQFSNFAQEDLGFSYFPPLENGFGTISIKSEINTMLFANVSNVSTENPMLCFSENGNKRSAYLLGENIWKWRMESYLANKNFEKFDQFSDKIIQFLAANNQKKSLVVNYESFYNSGEPIEISAQYFNKNYEFDENALLSIALKNKTNGTGKRVDFQKGNGEYKVNLDNLDAGNYSFTVTERNSNSSFSGNFEIIAFDIEKQFVHTDVDKLKQLAQNNNGTLYFPSNIDDLIKNLLSNNDYKTIQKEIVKKTPLIDWKTLLLIIALCLTIEWFTRKYNGLM